MGTTMKLTLAALLSGVALFVAVPAASAYTPGLGTRLWLFSRAWRTRLVGSR